MHPVADLSSKASRTGEAHKSLTFRLPRNVRLGPLQLRARLPSAATSESVRAGIVTLFVRQDRSISQVDEEKTHIYYRKVCGV